MRTKESLRAQFLEKRNALSYDLVIQKSKAIIEQLKKDPLYQNAKTVLFYVSKEKEVSTHSLIKDSSSKVIAVPKLVNNKILPVAITNFDELEEGKFHVPEPAHENKAENIDLVIVPGLVFDKGGNRIGYGKGHYDDLLKELRCPKIALAYRFQIINHVPTDKWDVKVDKIITD